jgi:hypothetical protein
MLMQRRLYNLFLTSIARLDVSYRTQFAGNVNRLSNSYFMMRLEYNLLNIFSKK